MYLRHVGGPPLRSYLTAGMGPPEEEEHAHAVREYLMKLSVDVVDHHCGILTIGETPKPIGGPGIRRWNLRVSDPQMNRSDPTQRLTTSFNYVFNFKNYLPTKMSFSWFLAYD